MKPLPDFSQYFDVAIPPGDRALMGYSKTPDTAYRAFPAVNASLLKCKTAAEMLHSIRSDDGDMYASESRAASLTEGTLLHYAVLEPWRFGIGSDPWGKPHSWEEFFVESPTEGLCTAKAAKTRMENPGKLLIKEKHLAIMQRAAEAIRWNDKAAALLEQPGHSELSGYVFDMSLGCRCKWRVDRLPSGPDACEIIDVKTTSASLFKFEDECWKFGYWEQAAWYLHCHELLTARRPLYFTFIAVTKEEPFMSRVLRVQNLPEDHPLYQGSALQKARDRIGIVPGSSGRIERLTVFINSAQQTQLAQARGLDLSAADLRRIWPGYEDEEIPFIGVQ